MPEQGRDAWDKADIILKPVGGLLTALAVALVGILGSQVLNRRQAIDTNVRVYAELMSKREEADTSLRKEMFNSIIQTFLKPQSAELERKILSLELLAYNFHESLDLGPLFKDVHRQIHNPPGSANQALEKRLERVAKDVTSKQIDVLGEAGRRVDLRPINLEELKDKPQGIQVLDEELALPSKGSGESAQALQKRDFRVEVLTANAGRKEVRVRLHVLTPSEPDIDAVFWLGYFDFPMIDNTRLPLNQRCALVLRDFGEFSAEITLVYFPGSRASLKDKPYYDEVIDLLQSPGRTKGS